jgi:hypothetical protein
MNINSEAIQTAFNNVLRAQGAYASAEQKAQMNGQTFKGSTSEWILNQGQYQSQLDYVDSIQQTINKTTEARNEQVKLGQSTELYDLQLKELDANLLEESKKLGQRPAMPQDELAAIQNKYKPASDAFQKTMEEYGYTFEDLGISTRKELRGLQSAMSGWISFISRADQMIPALMSELANPNLDVKTREQYETLLNGWKKVRGEAENALSAVDYEIQMLNEEVERMHLVDTFADTFKVILKGSKSFKEAFADLGEELRGNAVDSFMNKFSKKFNDLMSHNNDNGAGATIANMGKSFTDTWKSMDKNQKFQLAASAASLFIKNDNSRQSMQDQGIINGASQGFAMGGPIGAIVGGVIGFAMGDSQYKKQKKQNNADLRTSILDSMTTNTYQAYTDFLSAGQAGFGRTKKKHTLAGITSITGTDKEKLIKVDMETVIKKWQDLFANGGINDLINSTNTYLLQTYEKWSKFLDTLNASVSNIASSLENAFQADNYMGFVQSWGQSLEEMTRTALIRGFLAQGPLQTAYQHLSNTIGMAVLDGVLSGEEVSTIKAQGNAIASQMRVLYQSLALVDNMYADTGSSGSSGGSYTAGLSVPIVYNNYVTIEAGIFWGDKDQARQAALEIRDLILEEESRA